MIVCVVAFSHQLLYHLFGKISLKGVDMFWTIFFIALVVVVLYQIGTSSALKAANQAYQGSLTKLRSNPTDPELRQQTLNLGRHYSNLARNQKGVTVFDEVALMNDINAACAAATSQPVAVETPSTVASIEDRLAKAEKLRDAGAINADEYAAKRAQILRDL